MEKKEIVRLNYKRFCALDGSDFIASEFALEIILNLIDKYKIKNILELGLGIGSISDTVLKYSKTKNISVNYVGTEKNEFCLNVLKLNVEDYSKIKLYNELSEIKDQKFDLIIIDGQDSSFVEIVKYCNKRTILFIEGDRREQTKTVLDIFPKCLYVNVISSRKNKEYAHGISNPHHYYIGGGQLIFINPSMVMKIDWLFNKVLTKVKRTFRKYKR